MVAYNCWRGCPETGSQLLVPSAVLSLATGSATVTVTATDSVMVMDSAMATVTVMVMALSWDKRRSADDPILRLRLMTRRDCTAGFAWPHHPGFHDRNYNGRP